ncbi:hypothetical protein LCGC14_2523220, partial [marine sediment metagenome]
MVIKMKKKQIISIGSMFLAIVLMLAITTMALPGWNQLANNASNSGTGSIVNWTVNISDATDLNGSIFAHNMSGTMTNITDSIMTHDPVVLDILINYTLLITLEGGSNICGQFWFNNSAGNENQTDQSCFTVESTAPTISDIANIPISDTSATITWTTNEIANTTVRYGTATGSLTLTSETNDAITSHTRTLTNLNRLTNYFYTVTSCDPSGNCIT